MSFFQRKLQRLLQEWCFLLTFTNPGEFESTPTSMLGDSTAKRVYAGIEQYFALCTLSQRVHLYAVAIDGIIIEKKCQVSQRFAEFGVPQVCRGTDAATHQTQRAIQAGTRCRGVC